MFTSGSGVCMLHVVVPIVGGLSVSVPGERAGSAIAAAAAIIAASQAASIASRACFERHLRRKPICASPLVSRCRCLVFLGREVLRITEFRALVFAIVAVSPQRSLPGKRRVHSCVRLPTSVGRASQIVSPWRRPLRGRPERSVHRCLETLINFVASCIRSLPPHGSMDKAPCK